MVRLARPIKILPTYIKYKHVKGRRQSKKIYLPYLTITLQDFPCAEKYNFPKAIYYDTLDTLVLIN